MPIPDDFYFAKWNEALKICGAKKFDPALIEAWQAEELKRVILAYGKLLIK